VEKQITNAKGICTNLRTYNGVNDCDCWNGHERSKWSQIGAKDDVEGGCGISACWGGVLSG